MTGKRKKRQARGVNKQATGTRKTGKVGGNRQTGGVKSLAKECKKAGKCAKKYKQ